MRSFRRAIGLIGVLTVTALGQTPSEERPAERPAAQRRAAGGEPGPVRPAAMIERLRNQLDLDETQQAEFDRMAAAYREKLAAQRQGQAEAAEFVRQMREARQAGDDEKVRQIREQMRSRRTGGGRDVVQSFLDDVEKILRDDQKEKLGTMRERLADRGARGERGPRPFLAPERQIEQLREQLELTDEQRSTFDALSGDLRQRLTADGQPSIAELMQQLREAYVSQDREEAARLRKSVGERRAAAETAFREFAAQLEPTLTEAQKGFLAEFREQALRGMAPRAAADGVSLRSDPRMLLRAVRRLELSQEQKDQVRAIEADASKQMRSAGREGANELRAELDKQLRAILTPDQITQLDAILARQQQHGGRSKRDAASQPPAGPRRAPAADVP